jgi:hypothetical protein
MRIVFQYTFADLMEQTGLTKSAVSHHVKRGNLDPDSLVSVCCFLARYGKPEVRSEIVHRMIGIDRQEIERNRIQSTRNVGRNPDGSVANPAKPNGRQISETRAR